MTVPDPNGSKAQGKLRSAPVEESAAGRLTPMMSQADALALRADDGATVWTPF